MKRERRDLSRFKHQITPQKKYGKRVNRSKRSNKRKFNFWGSALRFKDYLGAKVLRRGVNK